MISRCRQVTFISVLTLYIVIYFIFLTTKHGRIFVYTLYGDKEAIDKIKVEENDTTIAFGLGLGMVFIGFAILSYTTTTLCAAGSAP